MLHLTSILRLLAAGWALLLAAIAAPASSQGVATPRAADVRAAAALTRHVVVISIDGLRPDAIDAFGATTLERLMREGSYSLEARTILPSLTLPSHTSMLTGEEPAAHGVTWNDNEVESRGVVKVPTVFSLAHQRGLRTAAFFSKGKFEHLEIPGSLDQVDAPSGNRQWSADRTVANVEEYLRSEKPNLMFVHLAEPDRAGHTFTWMSWFYGRAVRRADAAVASVLAAADDAFGEGRYTVLVSADHGGHGWQHGSDDPRDMTIPWIAWGEGVRAGTQLPPGIRTMDTGSTALWLLGLPPLGVGKPVEAAFVAPTPAR